MNKKWEDEFKKKFETKTKRFPKKDWPLMAKDYYKQTITPATNKKVISFIYTELAKQRTKLLARVREVVSAERMGNIVGVCLSCNAIRSGEGGVEPHNPTCLNESIKIIIKKLEIISEEGK